MNPLSYFDAAVVLGVFMFGIIAGIALDHWVKRQGSIANRVVGDVAAIPAGFVSEVTHLKAIGTAVQAAIAANMPPPSTAAAPAATAPATVTK